METPCIPVEPVAPGRAEGTVTHGSSVPAAAQMLFTAEADDPRLDDARWGGFLLAGRRSPGRPPVRPAVGDVDPDLVRDGEWAGIDGDRGELWLRGVEVVPVVTAFLEDGQGRVLLVRRSEKVGSFRGAWSAISGYLERPSALTQAVTEVGEETGIDSSALRDPKEGRRVRARDGSRVYVVHPFAFRVEQPSVRLDWENTEARWVNPEELPQLPTVPKLAQAWERARAGRAVPWPSKP